MPALIYDTSTQLFKEAENPKIYNESINAFVDSEGKVYNGTEWVDVYGDKPGTAIEAGQDYNLGSGAHTNTNGIIQIRCLSKSNNIAVVQTYGVTIGSWPGSGDLTASYRSYFGNLADAISGVKFHTVTATKVDKQVVYSNSAPEGSYDVLLAASSRFAQFGPDYNNHGAWTGSFLYYQATPTIQTQTYVYIFYAGYSNYPDTGGSTGGFVLAPYFTLDLTKVKIKKVNGVQTIVIN